MTWHFRRSFSPSFTVTDSNGTSNFGAWVDSTEAMRKEAEQLQRLSISNVKAKKQRENTTSLHHATILSRLYGLKHCRNQRYVWLQGMGDFHSSAWILLKMWGSLMILLTWLPDEYYKLEPFKCQAKSQEMSGSSVSARSPSVQIRKRPVLAAKARTDRHISECKSTLCNQTKMCCKTWKEHHCDLLCLQESHCGQQHPHPQVEGITSLTEMPPQLLNLTQNIQHRFRSCLGCPPPSSEHNVELTSLERFWNIEECSQSCREFLA